MKTDFLNPTHPGDVQQQGHVDTPLKHSTFPESYDFDQTLRFGELTPHFVMDAIAGDHINLRSAHSLRSFSLKSPLLQSISLKKDYFSVPMEAIYPFQWERIFTNPNIGSDVPSDAYGSVDLLLYTKSRVDNLKTAISDELADYNEEAEKVDPDPDLLSLYAKNILQYTIRLLTYCQYIYSNGSLLNYLGCCLSRLFDCTALPKTPSGTYHYSIDRVWDDFWSYCFGQADEDQITSFTVFKATLPYESVSFLPVDGHDGDEYAYTKRRYLEILLDDGDITIGTFQGSETNLLDWVSVVIPNIKVDTNGKKVDLSRVYAYQMTCAHFYSNDRVDYIYSAELWRQNLYNHYLKIDSTLKPTTFTYNGTKLFYDYTSANYFEIIDDSSYADADVLALYAYLFAFRKSLRYIDYFTGSKTSPLAIGDTNVDVSSDNDVSVVDITRKIQMQRFLNAVNRMGRKFSNYIKGLFGTSLAPDFHNPLYLGHTSDVVFGQETSNTGEAQLNSANSVTSVLKGNANSHAFDFNPDRPSILLGISYFDIARHYSNSIDRQFFIEDRFDMYNPFLEYIGDQPVYIQELNGTYLIDDRHDTDIFGYQTRYSEYKQRISRAVGGFVEYLPGYAFLSDNVPGLGIYPLISPDYIRSHPVELDEFYISLSGDSLASYFHFILTQSNFCTANRPMSFNPQIL